MKTYVAQTLLLNLARDAYVQPGEKIDLPDENAIILMEKGFVTPDFDMDHFEIVFNRDTEKNEIIPKPKKAGKIPAKPKEEDGGLADG